MTDKLYHVVAKRCLGLQRHDHVQTPVSLMYIFYNVVSFRRSGHISSSNFKGARS